jgi:hypothetical protein
MTDVVMSHYNSTYTSDTGNSSLFGPAAPLRLEQPTDFKHVRIIWADLLTYPEDFLIVTQGPPTWINTSIVYGVLSLHFL